MWACHWAEINPSLGGHVTGQSRNPSQNGTRIGPYNQEETLETSYSPNSTVIKANMTREPKI